MIETKVRIKNRRGLHARAAAKLVQTAARFNAQVTLDRDGQQVNAKSIMGVMMLAACKGAELIVRAEGEDESAATHAICELIDSKFDEQS